VSRWAKLAKQAGMDGVVCSPRETAQLRRELGADFLLVTPGIRVVGAPPDDQRRTMSAAEAIRSGAGMLVIGRPLTKTADPAGAADGFAREIASVLDAARQG
jgi:orotidine-5'-phosphate decarboxylase